MPITYLDEEPVSTGSKIVYLDDNDQPIKKSVGGFAGNVLKSGGEMIGNTFQAVAHPVQTVRGLADLVGGELQKIPISPLGALLKNLPGGDTRNQVATAVNKEYGQRYGNLERIRNTAYNDPVGSLMDLATLAGGVGGATSKVGKFANLERLAGIGEGISKASNVINPIKTSWVAKPVSKAISGSQVMAGRLINSIIKPASKEFNFGKNPGLAVAREGIVANNFDELTKNITQKRIEVGREIGNKVSPINKKINIYDVVNPIDDALTRAKEFPNSNAALINRLQGIKDDLLGIARNEKGQIIKRRNLISVSPAEATDLKTKIGDLTKWTKEMSDDSVANAALKNSYDVLKNKIGDAVPAVRELNERYANLLSAEIATKHRGNILQSQELMGVGNVGVGAAGALIGLLTTGTATGSGAWGLSAMAVRSALKKPQVGTRAAVLLGKVEPGKLSQMFIKNPNLRRGLIDALNNNEIKLPAGVIQVLKNQEGENF